MIILKFIRAIFGKRMWITLNWVRLEPIILAVLGRERKKKLQACFQVSVTEFLDRFYPWVMRLVSSISFVTWSISF